MNNFHIFRNPNYDLDKIPSIENGNLVKFVNNYFYAITEQLNNFSNFVETKMININRQINTCYTNLVILEMKLNSINVPNLIVEDLTPVSNEQFSQNKQSTPISTNIESKTYESSQDTFENETSLNETIPIVDDNIVDCPVESEDLSYLDTYKKMLKFGVHESAVKQKMLMDGLDPSLLNL